MKCSLKELFVLLIIYIAPTEGTQSALLLRRRSVQDTPMNLQQLRATINRLQDLDSFPVTSDSQLHKIVKKQMAVSDYRELRKNKRSVFILPEELPPPAFHISKVQKKSGNPGTNTAKFGAILPLNGEFLAKLFNFATDQGRQRLADPINEAKAQVKEKDEGTLDLGLKEEKQLQKLKDEVKKLQEMKDEVKKMQEMKDVTKLQDEKTQGKKSEEIKTDVLKIEDVKEDAKEKLHAAKTGKLNVENEKLKQLKDAEKRLNEIKNGDVFEDLNDEKKLKKFMDDEKAREIKEKKKVKELIQQEKEEAMMEEKKVKDLIEGKHSAIQVKPQIETKEKKKATKLTIENIQQENSCLAKHYRKIPDTKDYRYYYECEARPNGCLKLRHKRCPQGQFFSFKYLRCLNGNQGRIRAKKESGSINKKPPWASEDPEPANEWLDATQGVTPKIPAEFKPKKKPGLKIYHLRVRRKLHEYEQLWGKAGHESHRNVETSTHGKKHSNRHHIPRSFVVRVNKKEGKDQIAENDDNEKENDEEDEESDEEDEEDEADEEDDEAEDDDDKETTEEERPRPKDGLRDLLKSAKDAVTNRARFEDSTLETSRCTADQAGSKKSQTEDKKKVLIDANIRVDSTLSSVLKNLLKNKRKESNAGLVGHDENFIGAPDRSSPVLFRNSYEQLLKNNPRVKRYFLKRGVGEVAAPGQLPTN